MLRSVLTIVSLILFQITPVVPTETSPIYFTPEDISVAAPTRVPFPTPIEPDFRDAWADVPTEFAAPVSTERELPQWSLPTDWDGLTRQALAGAHHDYPADDINMPVGTPVYAIRAGTITSATRSDGGACGGKVTFSTDVGTFMYCHLSGVTVRVGDQVLAGYQVGFSGGRPGSYGAGSSTVAHLHVQWTRGWLVCPQPLLLSLWDQVDVNLTSTTRCVK